MPVKYKYNTNAKQWHTKKCKLNAIDTIQSVPKMYNKDKTNTIWIECKDENKGGADRAVIARQPWSPSAVSFDIFWQHFTE